MPKGSRRRALLVGAAAFIGFGAWAVFANRTHPMSDALRAGLVQGAFSFTSTTCSVLLLEYLYSLGRAPWQQVVLAMVGTPSIILGTMTVGHVVAGTPNVIMTLLPSYISATVFVVLYTLNLRRLLAAQRANRAA